ESVGAPDCRPSLGCSGQQLNSTFGGRGGGGRVGEADAIRRLVRLVSDGLRRSRPRAKILAQLVAEGISHDKAPELFAAVKQGIQAGVQAAFTAGLSAPDGPPADPLLAEAFREGQAALRGSVRRVWLERLAIPVGLVLLLAVLFLGRLLGWWGQ